MLNRKAAILSTTITGLVMAFVLSIIAGIFFNPQNFGVAITYFLVAIMFLSGALLIFAAIVKVINWIIELWEFLYYYFSN